MKRFVKYSLIRILFIIGINTSSFSQFYNESSLEINIERNLEFKEAELYKLSIVQTVCIDSKSIDSVVLLAPSTIEIRSPQLGLHFDSIIGISHYKITQNQLVVYFDKKKTYNFEIFYKYLGNVPNLNLTGANLSNFYYWDAQEEYWYFDSPQIRFKNISITYPSNYYLLESFSHNSDTDSVKPNKERFNADNTKNIPLQFILLNKTKYEREIIINQNQQLCVHIPIDSKNNPLFNKDFLIRNIESQFNKVISFFEGANSRDIDVIQINWNKSGRALGNQIICDSTFFYNHNLLHELIHLYSDIRALKQDRGYFFIDESLTEFLAVFLYENFKSRNIYFIRKIAYYALKLGTNNSIFEVKINSKENWALIYGKTPFIIHLLSQRVNEGEFYRILNDFYREYSQKEVTFEDFSSFLRNQGIDEKVLNEFISLL